MHRSNIGRYVLDIINKHIIKRKKKVFYKDLNLTFYVPNRLSYYRADSFSTKEPETLSWIDSFDAKSTFWDIGANIGIYSCYAAKKKIAKIAPILSWGGCDVDYEWQLPMVEFWLKKNGY